MFGTERYPSGPVSNAESLRVGGERSTPRTTGGIAFPVERTVMFFGEVSSVRKRSSGELEDRNSDTVPVSEMRSPDVTEARMDAEDVKTFKPYEARMSDDGVPLSQNPELPY